MTRFANHRNKNVGAGDWTLAAAIGEKNRPKNSSEKNNILDADAVLLPGYLPSMFCVFSFVYCALCSESCVLCVDVLCVV